MSLVLSRPFEELVPDPATTDVHTLIVGSGYGAAMAALALAMREGKPYMNREILVIERGNEFVPGDFPKTVSDLPAHLSILANGKERTGYADALFDLRVGDNVSAVVGSGLGGTSLINAGVAVDPTEEVFKHWPSPATGGSWMKQLEHSLAFVRALLGVKPHPRGFTLAKVQALKKLAQAMACSQVKSAHELADIAVNFEDGANAVGVTQKACTDCGNCFTGCNIGAKSTLAMNAWPLATSLGVDVVTGGTVRSVKQSPTGSSHAWTVLARRTSDDRMLRTIRAHRVILAAGTFGSTEVLARSFPALALGNPEALGRGFSLNGDGIAFGFGQEVPVNAYAKVPSSIAVQPAADERPGPTIASVMSMRGREGERGLIEDATVPQALSRLWAELLSTQAMTHAFVSDTPSAWHQKNSTADPLTVSRSLMDHHQVVLTIGVDNASGRLRFEKDQLSLAWPPLDDKPANAAAQWFHESLHAAGLRGGFGGGLHLASPVWKPLPDEFDKVFEGASRFGGAHLCNHPLGGCPMGDSAASGVVNSRGQVYRSQTEVHDSLYVLDASILPGALGINPYMTIAALAHRLAMQMDGDRPPARVAVPTLPRPFTFPPKQGRTVDWPVPALSFDFKERLFGPGDKAQAEAIAKVLGTSRSDAKANGLAIDAAIHIPDVEAWLEDPSQTLEASFVGYRHQRPDRVIDTVDDEDLEELFRADGTVRLFARDASPDLICRGFRAFERFVMLRSDEILSAGAGSDPSAFIRVAKQHGHWRYLEYAFDAQVNGQRIEVSGNKRLAYDGRRERKTRDEGNLWNTLTTIELCFVNHQACKKATGLFRVDLLRMGKDLRPLQHTGGAETPQLILGAASVGALALRVIVQTHLWSFAAPSYTCFPSFDEANEPRSQTPTQIVYFWNGEKTTFQVSVARPRADGWRLLRARPKKPVPGRAPVLLIHGLAHSSRVFCTETVDRNLAGHLLFTGNEVWLLDHGISTAWPDDGSAPNIDEIAKQVKEAVSYVYESMVAEGMADPRVNVFSHCVGSAAFSMSALDGNLDIPGSANRWRSKIRSLVMHAVPPWIHASENNMLRAYVGVFFKDRFFPDKFDPIPYDEKKARRDGTPAPKMPFGDLLMDRFASSMPWTEDDYKDHSQTDRDHQFGRTICNRMTSLYSYEWTHDNLDRRTHCQLASLVGPANANAYRNLYFLVNRKRVTDRFGQNKFVQVQKFLDHWNFPTLFLHGSHNQVFDAESSRLSAHLLASINAMDVDGRPPQTVDLKIVDGYGHMDLLFGQEAWHHVFEDVATFFEKGGTNVRPEPPKSQTVATTLPVTGPIISRPRADGDLRVLRVWVETNEFQASDVKGVRFAYGDEPLCRLDAKVIALPSDVNFLKRSRFWLYDVNCMQPQPTVGAVVISDPPGIPATVATMSLTNDANTPCVLTPGPRDMAWAGLPWFQRFIAGGAPPDRLAFVVGSCLYPGSWFDHDVSDRIYRKIREEVQRAPGIDHLLLVGDQIYADASRSMFDIAEHRERYQESYRRAFNSCHAAWVLRHVPTYMGVDDHEFKDNAPRSILGGKLGNELSDIEQAAHEAWNFQMHHGERPIPNETSPLWTNRLWYDYESAGCCFFVFDTRSERKPLPDIRRTVSQAQWKAFKDWLPKAKSSGRPAFIVTGSPLAPAPSDEVLHPARAQSSDTLRAHPAFVRALAAEVAAAGLPFRTVWLSGDSHFSSICDVEVRDAGGLRCPFLSVVSSGLNVPLPFANEVPDDTAWEPVTLRLPAVDVHISGAALLCERRAHALRMELSSTGGSWSMEVSVLDADLDTPRTVVRRRL